MLGYSYEPCAATSLHENVGCMRWRCSVTRKSPEFARSGYSTAAAAHETLAANQI